MTNWATRTPIGRKADRSGPGPAPVVPPKLFSIGEIVRHTGLSRQTIHNYTTMGLIYEAQRTPGGHRLYDEQVFHRLARIAQLKTRQSMEDIRQMMVGGRRKK